MPWPIPICSRREVNRAGDLLAGGVGAPEAIAEAMARLQNWRSCHGYPLNTFQSTLRRKLRHIDTTAIVAQRLKRTPSIIAKLRRTPGMQLARMNDIGGLRAVVSNMHRVRQIESSYTTTRFRHELDRSYDYISEPKTSGYRSLHLVYKYRNPRVPEYDNMRVELQVRTRIQHAWAMAVETMGVFLGQALKASEGAEEWLEFFKIAASAFAFMEDCPPLGIHEDWTQQAVIDALRSEVVRLNVIDRLTGYVTAAEAIQGHAESHSYHLIILDPTERQVRIRSYSRQELDRANSDYAQAESSILAGQPIQAVLVSAGPLADLTKAYPSYFLDADEFVRYLEIAMK